MNSGRQFANLCPSRSHCSSSVQSHFTICLPVLYVQAICWPWNKFITTPGLFAVAELYAWNNQIFTSFKS